MNPINVLISLHPGYGLGDAVQVSSVLRHVAAARPEWVIDYQAEEGKHGVGRGIVANTFAYGAKYPSPHYDAEVQICLYDTWANFHDRPNTRVSSCLHERFGLGWLPEYGRYHVDVSEESERGAIALLHGTVQKRVGFATRDDVPSGHGLIHRPRSNYVAVHYEGDSSPGRKNLTHGQADDVCCAIAMMGYTPLILDWRRRCPLDWRKVRIPVAWGGDAEMVCAVIRQCVAFVGIDSGPSKCASSTDVPTLVTWTGHHPAPFHDPAPNTTHLVPAGYHGLEPVCSDAGVMRWFDANYSVFQYDRCPVVQIKRWLSEVLK